MWVGTFPKDKLTIRHGWPVPGKSLREPSIQEVTMRVYNKTLDPKLWNENLELDPEVRLSLLKIGQDFYSGTDLQGEIVDIFLIGSSANYNWTTESDLDVHVIIDISQEKINPKYARKFMDSLTGAWNKEHEIEIKDHPVEVYLQDKTEPNGSPDTFRPGVAIYSLLQNKWMARPSPQKLTLDKDKIKSKYRQIKSQIEDLSKTEDYSNLKGLMKKIKNYRNAGLKQQGEFGTENLVFKALRHTGMLQKLKDAIQSSYDKMVTIDEVITKRPFIISGMTAQDLDVTGEKYYEGEPMITHGVLRAKYGSWSGSEDWRYRSDINVLFWWGLPDEDVRESTLNWLARKYDVRHPKEVTAKSATDQIKQLVHYPFIVPGKKLFKEVDEKNAYYVVGIVTDDLSVIAKRYGKRENYITHDQLRSMYGVHSTEYSIHWRYHSLGNWIYWWDEPTWDQKMEVLEYLKNKFGVVNPRNKVEDHDGNEYIEENLKIKPFLIVGVVNEDFQVFGKRDFGKQDKIGSTSLEHANLDFEMSRSGWNWNVPFSHWRYKSINNTLYWWPGDPYNEDLKNVVFDYLHTKWNIKNPIINRNKEAYFDDAHFVLEILCEENVKDYIIYGNVDDDFHVNAVRKHKADGISGGNHFGVGKRWRFRTNVPYVFWWEKPTPEDEESVELYLYKHYGIKIKDHKIFWDLSHKAAEYLHGVVMPKPTLEVIKEGIGDNYLIIGSIDEDDLSVIGWKTYDEEFTHMNLLDIKFSNRQFNWRTDLRWRFKGENNTIYWGKEFPSESEEQAVEDWLNKNYNIKNVKHNTSELAYWKKAHSLMEAKFNPFKDKLQFVTYGGLSLQKQKGFDPSKLKSGETFHSPPARKGIYAFVWPYVEKFLLGGDKFVDPKIRGKGQRQRIQYVRDKEGNVITSDHPEFEKYSNIQKNWSLTRRRPDAPTDPAEDADFDDIYHTILYTNVQRKKFSYNGPLWHHLIDKVPQDKILDEKGTWIKTDMETYHDALMKELHTMASHSAHGGGKIRTFTLDHLEVFIDQKI